jgi:hypothetical protein
MMKKPKSSNPMKTYIKHRSKNFIPPGTFSTECYGPFATHKGAKVAAVLVQRINVNTGQYFNSVNVVRRKNEPEFHTLTWPEWCACANVHTRKQYGKLHL